MFVLHKNTLIAEVYITEVQRRNTLYTAVEDTTQAGSLCVLKSFFFVMSILKFAAVWLMLFTFSIAKGISRGGYMSLPPETQSLTYSGREVAAFPENVPFSALRALSTKQCPCQCAGKVKANNQCRKLGAFCEQSECMKTDGNPGNRCCLKGELGFGICECLPNRIVLGISFENELAARNAAADFCAERRLCPPDCDCSACSVSAVFCLEVNKVWACRADCKGESQTCRPIVG